MGVKRIVIRAVTLTLGVVIGLGIGEIGVRVVQPQRTGPLQVQADSRYFSILVPNLRGRETLPGVYTWSFAHDSSGRRVTGLVNREGATTRVLLLGDSFTYGLGVNDDQTFAYLLEQRLSQGERQVAVINAGNPAKGTDYALKFFELEARSLKPDVTVLCFFANDFRDNGLRGHRLYQISTDGTLSARKFPESDARPRLRRTVYRWMVSWSHVVNLARKAVLRLRESRLAGLPADPFAGYVTEANTKDTGIFLRHLVRSAREGRSDLLVFYFPSADEVKFYRETGKMPKADMTLRELLGPIGVVPTSLTPALAASDEPLENLYFDEQGVGRPSGHWTATAHSIAAGVIDGVLRTRLQERKPVGQH